MGAWHVSRVEGERKTSQGSGMHARRDRRTVAGAPPRARALQRTRTPSSFIRTMTVGSGIGPDLLTFPRQGRRKALAGSSHGTGPGDLPPVGSCTPP